MAKSKSTTNNSGLPTPDFSLPRCTWPKDDGLYIAYHDHEWGKPVHDDKILFEFLILEAAQAGLSWITILRRRENYRKAYAGFDVKKVAKFDERDVERLMNDEGIIRNRLKVTSSIRNAQLFLDLQEEFGSFNNYLYSFMPDKKPLMHHRKNNSEVPATSPESDAIAKDMKKRGFKFFGSVICYAHMQATGMVNDHLVSCFCHPDFNG
ncbi:MAG: DNA-3-methyladenine glycosylase I [Mucilaginibacter polytrichastri]|nr:DNA-3-methyladenine glycosylase I [Mucilaginibacter polytrichastri]